MSQPSNRAGNVPTLLQLFRGFARVGFSGFGGVLPFVRRVVVEQEGWLAPGEFNSLLGLCQFLPGPNVINLSVAVGARFRGLPGVFACVAGLLGGPFIIALVLALGYDRWGALPQVQSMLTGISCAGAGLIFAMGWRMAESVGEKLFFLPFAAAVFLGVGVLHLPMAPVMLGLALPATLVAWWRAKRR